MPHAITGLRVTLIGLTPLQTTESTKAARNRFEDVELLLSPVDVETFEQAAAKWTTMCHEESSSDMHFNDFETSVVVADQKPTMHTTSDDREEHGIIMTCKQQVVCHLDADDKSTNISPDVTESVISDPFADDELSHLHVAFLQQEGDDAGTAVFDGITSGRASGASNASVTTTASPAPTAVPETAEFTFQLTTAPTVVINEPLNRGDPSPCLFFVTLFVVLGFALILLAMFFLKKHKNRRDQRSESLQHVVMQRQVHWRLHNRNFLHMINRRHIQIGFDLDTPVPVPVPSQQQFHSAHVQKAPRPCHF